MAAKRTPVVDARQISFAWIDAAELLETASRRGPVVYEAPDSSRIVRSRPPRVPRVRMRRPAEPPSLGLPFGVHEQAGRITCWSCGEDLEEHDVVTTGPGSAICPGCGARLPFAE